MINKNKRIIIVRASQINGLEIPENAKPIPITETEIQSSK